MYSPGVLVLPDGLLRVLASLVEASLLRFQDLSFMVRFAFGLSFDTERLNFAENLSPLEAPGV